MGPHTQSSNHGTNTNTVKLSNTDDSSVYDNSFGQNGITAHNLAPGVSIRLQNLNFSDFIHGAENLGSEAAHYAVAHRDRISSAVSAAADVAGAVGDATGHNVDQYTGYANQLANVIHTQNLNAVYAPQTNTVYLI